MMDPKKMQQMQKMQEELMKAQDDFARKTFTGSAGGGAVMITVNGDFEMTNVKVSPEALDAAHIEELETMIKSAYMDAHAKMSTAQHEQMQRLTNGMGIPGLF